MNSDVNWVHHQPADVVVAERKALVGPDGNSWYSHSVEELLVLAVAFIVTDQNVKFVDQLFLHLHNATKTKFNWTFKVTCVGDSCCIPDSELFCSAKAHNTKICLHNSHCSQLEIILSLVSCGFVSHPSPV